MDQLYRAYLLRLQRNQEQDYWRATLENAHTGEQIRFATERELLLYLLQSLKIDPADKIDPFSQADGHHEA